RLGLCGAINWLDGKASYEISPTGPNQPWKKGEVIDATKGQWKGINEAVYKLSHGKLERFNAYSIIENPMTSCFTRDTEVIIDDEAIELGEFIDKHRGGEEYAKCCALTLNHGKTVLEKIVAMQKFPAPERLIKIETKSGMELVLTPEHEVAVDRAKELAWVRADQISPSDRVIGLKRLNIGSKIPASNTQKVIEYSTNCEELKTLSEVDYFLDIVTKAEEILNQGKYRYVYNLTLADTHCYFANSLLVKNCGCFECVLAIVPEANGILVINREYPGDTPIGMKFSTLAGTVGGGNQTPGFLGVGRRYLLSKKFLSADGGFFRIVWMPKMLKDDMHELLSERGKELDAPDFVDKIADETIATNIEELVSYLEKVKHPALTMPPIM
ncbi:MAG: hypothetical protein AB1485_07955, partial [Candidatus Thermoplasmatota archaeon]